MELLCMWMNGELWERIIETATHVKHSVSNLRESDGDRMDQLVGEFARIPPDL